MTYQAGNHYLAWLLNRLNVQSGPDDLVSLNTLDGYPSRRLLLSIGLRSMKVQLSPDGVSFYHLIENLYPKIWHRREKETPVFPHSCLSDEVSFRVERLLTTIVWGKTRHHDIQIVSIRSLNHALEYYLGDECLCASCPCSSVGSCRSSLAEPVFVPHRATPLYSQADRTWQNHKELGSMTLPSSSPSM
jgi:hypothetical protein